MRDQDFRDLMAGVCAPVTVVTTTDDDGPHGATVSSFASPSLEPPLVTVALDRRSGLLARILGGHAVVPPQVGYEVYGKALLGVEDSITPLV